jgi:hypothetical protein
MAILCLARRISLNANCSDCSSKQLPIGFSRLSSDKDFEGFSKIQKLDDPVIKLFFAVARRRGPYAMRPSCDNALQWGAVSHAASFVAKNCSGFAAPRFKRSSARAERVQAFAGFRHPVE